MKLTTPVRDRLRKEQTLWERVHERQREMTLNRIMNWVRDRIEIPASPAC